MPHPGRSDDDAQGERAHLPHDERQPDERRAPSGRWADRGSGWGPRARWTGDVDGVWEPRFRFSRWARLWLPVILSLVVQVPGAVFTWRFRQFATVGDDEPWRLAVRVGLALLGALALIAARRFPGPVVAVVSAAAGAYALLVAGELAPPYIALAFAIVGAVVRGARLWAWWSLGVTWVVTVTLGIVFGVDWQPAAVVAVTLLLVLLLGIGEGIRTRRTRLDELRRRAAERRLTEVQAERVRIARELHDVLAHSLSQINVQAGVGLHLIDSQPELAASALANIKETSKSALDEVRSVLGVLREGQDAPGAEGSAPLVPEPDLSRIDGLVASVVSQGLAVTLRNGIAAGGSAGGGGAGGGGAEDGSGPGASTTDRSAPDRSAPPKAVQLALYRIVQESLTNVIRHANATSATVVLAETPDAYTVSVTDDGAASTDGAKGPGGGAKGPGGGAGDAAGPTSTTGRSRARDASGGDARRTDLASPRLGRGLLGMRERAELLGGHLDAGPRPGGGFAVEAVIPRRVAPTLGEPSAPPVTVPRPAAAPPVTVPRPAAAPHMSPPAPDQPPTAPPSAAAAGSSAAPSLSAQAPHQQVTAPLGDAAPSSTSPPPPPAPTEEAP